MKKHLLIIGGGFAGFWSAISAVRQSREIQEQNEVEITLINPDNYVTLRPRLNELSLISQQFELDKYLKPLGVHQIVGRAELIDPERQEVVVSTEQGLKNLNFDCLILAPGSSLVLPNLTGLDNTFKIDSFDNARRLEDHIIGLAKGNFHGEGATTFVVVGSEFLGLEAVVDIEQKARTIQAYYSENKSVFRMVLLEGKQNINSYFSNECALYIQNVLASRPIDIVSDNSLVAVSAESVLLQDGNSIATRTVIWTKDIVASSLTRFFKSPKDCRNRLKVDQFLKLPEYGNIIAAGSVAQTKGDRTYSRMVDCRYAQLEGRWAGHNAINALFNLELKEYIHPGYPICVDLGEPQSSYFNDSERTHAKMRYNERAVEAYINKATIYPWRNVEETVKASFPEIPGS